jgi:glycosyltransferase involved in cell wall biosynthesis
MKILMVSSYLPYPLHSGGQIRLYNLLKLLQKDHEITLICEKRDSQTQEDIMEVQKICHKVITIKRRKQWTVRNVLKSSLSSHSFLYTGHENTEMRQKIKEEIENNTFDLIHVETYYVMQNLPQSSSPLPVVLIEHNIEYQVYSRFVQKAPLLIRSLLALDVAKIKKEEINFWQKATKVAAVSLDDQRVIQSQGIKAEIVPNGVDINFFSFKNRAINSEKEKKILFIGDFKWLQNRDSVSWIIKEIWPLINKANNIKLIIIGRNIPYSIKKLTNDSNIIFDEKSSAKPTRQIFQEADLLLAPIRVGGGTSYKILESMASGTPALISPLSAGSLELIDGKEAMVGETAADFARKIDIVLNDSNLYQKIASNGRALIEKKYTWGEIAKKLNNVYESAANIKLS